MRKEAEGQRIKKESRKILKVQKNERGGALGDNGKLLLSEWQGEQQLEGCSLPAVVCLAFLWVSGLCLLGNIHGVSYLGMELLVFMGTAAEADRVY